MATRLAEAHDGVVINADAMQVYRDLAILTARPTAEDEARVPHALYGHVDAARSYSVAEWLAEAGAAIAAALDAGRLPVVVGGSGLYLAALAEGLSSIPPVPETVRARWRERAREEPAVHLHGELARRDPEAAARLRPSDRQRIVRALEVLEATGRSLLVWQRERAQPVLPPGLPVTRLVVAPERAELRRRIGERFAAMLTAGAVEEAARLTARDLPLDRPALKAIGVRPLAALAAGTVTREEAVTRAVTETRQYAKRQETWLRNRFPDWHRMADPSAPVPLEPASGPA